MNHLPSAFTPPDLPPASIQARLARSHGLAGTLTRLRGEREQNARLATADGKSYVVKIARTEDAAAVDCQCAALLHLQVIDPGLAVPRVVPAQDGRAICEIADETGQRHIFSVLTYLEGQPLIAFHQALKRPFTAKELFAVGAMQGRVARALQSFHHPATQRNLPWDLKNEWLLGPRLGRHLPPELRDISEPHLSRYEARTLPALRRLRGQVIHHDFHESNLLVEPGADLRFAGLIDFGDMIYGARAEDLAVSLSSFVDWGPDPAASLLALTRGYHSAAALDREDLALLPHLALLRTLLTIAMMDHLTEGGKPNAEMLAIRSMAIRNARTLSELDAASMSTRIFDACLGDTLGAGHQETGGAAIADDALFQRRVAVLGKTYTFYRKPIHIVRGEGTWLHDAEGRAYLDCYNNVPLVGHSHPHVVAAAARQLAVLNTNTRYLQRGIVELGERLTATMGDGLDTVIFTCTGSEANDLAVRIARTVTGRHGVLIAENAYHGNTTLTTHLSPLEYPPESKPDWVALLPAPNIYRGPFRNGDALAGEHHAAFVAKSIDDLAAAGHRPAALLIDAIFDSNGSLNPPADYLGECYRRARQAGALCIADEVQMGFGRSGTHLWGFEAFGVKPDIVTLGKPMANGYPCGAVITRRDIARRFNEKFLYFNTFGGGTAACAAAAATLDVLEGEGLQQRALQVGAWLGKEFDALKQRFPVVGHVHGRGLFFGLDLVADRETRAPDKLTARSLSESMKEKGVLVASSGPMGNILKIRPPLSMTLAEAGILVAALRASLLELRKDRD